METYSYIMFSYTVLALMLRMLSSLGLKKHKRINFQLCLIFCWIQHNVPYGLEKCNEWPQATLERLFISWSIPYTEYICVLLHCHRQFTAKNETTACDRVYYGGWFVSSCLTFLSIQANWFFCLIIKQTTFMYTVSYNKSYPAHAGNDCENWNFYLTNCRVSFD